MATGVRVAITLACTECKRRNYQTQKSKRNSPDRVEFKKYCRWCGRHTPHRETRELARETRRQRRAARAAAGDGAATSRRARAAQVRPSQQPVKQQTGRKTERQRGQFVREAYAELRKVDWPTRNQTFQGVVVVIIACVIVGAYLWGLDQIIRPVVDKVLL